jgi:hypothetical protein
LSFNPGTQFAWGTSDTSTSSATPIWTAWQTALGDNSASGAFAGYSLINEIQGADPWTTMGLNITVSPVDINGNEGGASTAVGMVDNTPPRIGQGSLTAAPVNYPVARLTLRGTTANANTTTAAYADSASGTPTATTTGSILTVLRDPARTSDTSTMHVFTLLASEPLAKASLNVDATSNGVPDNVTLSAVALVTATVDPLYTGQPNLASVGTGPVPSGACAGCTVVYAPAGSFSAWPGVDLNLDSDANGAAKYQALTLAFDNVFGVRTGLGVKLGTGVTDLFGNAVPSNQKIAYLVDGIPPLVQTVAYDNTNKVITVTFTEPVDLSTIAAGLTLSAAVTGTGAVLSNTNTAIGTFAGFSRTGPLAGSAYEANAAQTAIKMYLSAALPAPFGPATLVQNTAVADLAPSYTDQATGVAITGSNTVADDATGAPIAGLDTGAYLLAYPGGKTTFSQ